MYTPRPIFALAAMLALTLKRDEFSLNRLGIPKSVDF